jgi:hypothetical protein
MRLLRGHVVLAAASAKHLKAMHSRVCDVSGIHMYRSISNLLCSQGFQTV